MRGAMILCTVLTAALVLFLMGYVLINGIPNISWELLSTKPSYLTERIGILPDILNTVYIVLATLVIVLPLGVGAAIYLTEYAKNKKLVAMIEYAAERGTIEWRLYLKTRRWRPTTSHVAQEMYSRKTLQDLFQYKANGRG